LTKTESKPIRVPPWLPSCTTNYSGTHTTVREPLAGADPASKFRGAISIIFGSHVSLRVHYCKRDEVYFTTLLWKNNGRQNSLISRMLFSEL